MDNFGMMQFNERAAAGVCFSLPGALSVVPVRFSLSAPELNFGSRFTVSARIRMDWQLCRERMEHFFVTIAGMFRSAADKIARPVYHYGKKVFNVLRFRSLTLSRSGRRL